MTQREAARLADAVRAAGAESAAVESEGRYFVVTVEAASGHYTLRDEADLAWLRVQVLGSR